ncbi:unnamed protein product [Diplocarpon coronariae]
MEISLIMTLSDPPRAASAVVFRSYSQVRRDLAVVKGLGMAAGEIHVSGMLWLSTPGTANAIQRLSGHLGRARKRGGRRNREKVQEETRPYVFVLGLRTASPPQSCRVRNCRGAVAVAGLVGDD